METTPINLMRALVAANVFAALNPVVQQQGLGRVLPGGLYYVLWKATDVPITSARVPDVSFLRTEHLQVFDTMMPYPGTPDFALECVTVTEADMVSLDKVRDYLTAGTDEVWLAYVGLQELHRYRRAEPKVILAYSGDDLITSELFPGLSLRTADLFQVLP